jgi:hypothetical protein
MKTQINRLVAGTVLGVVLLFCPLSGMSGWLDERFEGYLVGTNLSAYSAAGWYASDSTVIITNGIGTNASHSASLPSMTVVSNAINKVGGTGRIWSEFSLCETYGMDPLTAPEIISNATAAVALSTGGYVMVYNPVSTNWMLCTNDVLGSNVQAVAIGSWPTVSVCVDYGRSSAAVFLNDHLLVQAVQLISNLATYGQFTCQAGGTSNSFLDNVSASNAVPATLAGDIDDDGRPDAVEIDQFGSISVTGRISVVASATNSAGGSVSPAGSVTGIKYNGTTNFLCSARVGYVLDHVWTNGVVASNYDHAVKTTTYVWPGINVDGGLFQVGFYYIGLFVPDDYGTITDALAVAQAGDSIVVSNGTYALSVTLSNGVSLVGTNMTGLDSDLTIQGALTVAAGATGSVQRVGVFTVTGAVTVAAGGRLVLTNVTSLSFGSLSIGSGGTLQVCNGTLTVSGITLTGTFTLDSQWGSFTPSVLNFADSFEWYDPGKLLSQLGSFGWSASDMGAVVSSSAAPGQGSKGLDIPLACEIANAVTSTSGKVWTDFWWREPAHCDVIPLVGTNCAVQFYVGTNNFLTIYNRGAWDVCSNDFWGVTNNLQWAVDTWHRVTVFEDFSGFVAAFFLDGRLLRTGVPFVHDISRYAKFSYSAGSGNEYLDAVNIQTNPPATSDGDGDGIDDASELHQYGNLSSYPRGVVYKIR